MSGSARRRWNHNLHFHRAVINALPDGASTALDAGTGDGFLAVDLHRRVSDVVGIDTAEDVLAAAANNNAGVT